MISAADGAKGRYSARSQRKAVGHGIENRPAAGNAGSGHHPHRSAGGIAAGAEVHYHRLIVAILAEHYHVAGKQRRRHRRRTLRRVAQPGSGKSSTIPHSLEPSASQNLIGTERALET